MSLARAFTTRRKNNDAVSATAQTSYIGRAASQRSPNSKPIIRAQISSPVELISTTNMLSYEAPDIQGTRPIAHQHRNVSSSSSVDSDSMSDAESDHSGTSHHSNSTAATSVDDYSPTSSPALNHLSCYFKPEMSTSTASNRGSHSTTASYSPSLDYYSPNLPQRAPSHSKKAHVLSHKRSVQRIGSQGSHERQISRDSVDMFSKDFEAAPVSHPFGKELEQLSEAAEEFGSAVRDAEAEADLAIMRSKGLAQFCASDYMSELSGYYSNTFEEDAAVYQPMVWI